MIKLTIIALMLASCVNTQPPFPTNTEKERECKEAYEAGKLTYSKYKECLETEHGP